MNKITIFPLKKIKQNFFQFFSSFPYLFEHEFDFSDLYLKLLIKNGKIIIFFLVISANFLSILYNFNYLDPDPDPHKNNGSGSRGPNLCGSGRIRIRNTIGIGCRYKFNPFNIHTRALSAFPHIKRM